MNHAAPINQPMQEDFALHEWLDANKNAPHFLRKYVRVQQRLSGGYLIAALSESISPGDLEFMKNVETALRSDAPGVNLCRAFQERARAATVLEPRYPKVLLVYLLNEQAELAAQVPELAG